MRWTPATRLSVNLPHVPRITGTRLLLIEDNPGDAELVSRALARATQRCEVEMHIRLRDALARDDLTEFDVALADLSLPDACGLQCVRQLRERAPQLPCIVLTSLASDAMADEAIEAGAQDYLVKDRINPEQLERAMRYAMQRNRARMENERLLKALRNSQKLLQEKNQRLQRACSTAQQFVDNVSHEFRTPLTVILEYASLLRDGIPGVINDDQRRLLDVIDDRTCDLNNMVDDMLDVSKLESGLLGIWRRTCQVDEIVRHVLPLLQRKAEVRRVVLETDIPDDLPAIFCDPEKIGRILVNLVVNAVKFCGDPGLVRLTARRCGDDVRLSVSDNGAGIPLDRREEIFQRFSQLHNAQSQSTKGFGLGLSIAQELAELNYTSLHVDAGGSGGSVFSFAPPIADPLNVAKRHLAHLADFRNAPSGVVAYHAEVVGDLEATNPNDVEGLFCYVLRQHDLALPAEDGSWLLLAAVNDLESERFVERFHEEQAQINRNRPRGPLPEIALRPLGSWDVTDRLEETIECVRTHFDRLELCHA
ncbi:MAG: hybrid sensor histidine kinase/response regulator [Planctomycetales bacterium]|nr:hybrid sensor histidine kinase/response regulator [Planctomycetales bacterium]